MKKIYAALAGLLLMAFFAMPADAASWNVRQKDTGARVLTDGSVEVPDSGAVYVVPITNTINQITHYVVSHNAGKIKKIYAVNHLAYPTASGAPSLNFSYSDGTTAAFTPISAGSTTPSLTLVTTTAGRSATLTPADSRIDIQQGYVIAIKVIHSGTTVTGGVPATVTIVVE